MKRASMHRGTAGFSLIEVLIALVVLAFGLLGLGLLQTMNLRYTKSANQRTMAVNLAGEMLDMMRSNRSEISAYTMDLADMSSVTLPSSGCSAGATLGAASNVSRWQCEVHEALGDAAGARVETTAENEVTVTLTWDESSLPGLGDSNVVLSSRL